MGFLSGWGPYFEAVWAGGRHETTIFLVLVQYILRVVGRRGATIRGLNLAFQGLGSQGRPSGLITHHRCPAPVSFGRPASRGKDESW